MLDEVARPDAFPSAVTDQAATPAYASASNRRALRYKGVVRPEALDPNAAYAPMPAEGEWQRLRLPGVELDWQTAVADVACADGVLALATGRARDGTSPAGGGEAQ